MEFSVLILQTMAAQKFFFSYWATLLNDAEQSFKPVSPNLGVCQASKIMGVRVILKGKHYSLQNVYYHLK